jgi:Coenzyme PQQ synthesis protein D (PqqD)
MAARKRPSSGDILGAAARVPDHVVHRSFAHETVILNLKTGKYHGLNPTAGTMLTELQRRPTVAEAVAPLSAKYGRPPEEIESDLSDLCIDLLARGLIELTDSDGRPFEAAESGDDS